jgi:hypothetical protein
MPLVVRNPDFLRPSRGELGDPLNVVESLRCDDGPLRQSGPQSGWGLTGVPYRGRSLQLSARS